MNRNEGTVDRTLRAAVGVALVALTASGHIGLWGWIGVAPLATALLGWCPAYSVLGIRTCKTGSRGAASE